MNTKKLVPLALSGAIALTALAPAVGTAKATDTGRHVVTTTELPVFKQPAANKNGWVLASSLKHR